MDNKCNNVYSDEVEKFIRSIKFDDKGLVPVVVQEVVSKDVLMLAYMNKDAIKKTLKDKVACYFSRSRQELWVKGETSGNTQKVVKSLMIECENTNFVEGSYTNMFLKKNRCKIFKKVGEEIMKNYTSKN
ncbi:MAG: phosphoribosyl-AMP cyclohydrolase [Clostridioides difficile]